MLMGVERRDRYVYVVCVQLSKCIVKLGMCVCVCVCGVTGVAVNLKVYVCVLVRVFI